MKRFLIIQLRQVGDVILTTPIAHILKEAHPAARVAFLTESPSHHLLSHNPYIDEVLVTRRRDGVWRTLNTIWRLRQHRFDAVLDFMANPRSAQLAFGSGAPMRISYPKKGRGRLYTHQVTPADGYAVTYKKSLLAPLQITSDWLRPEIFLTPMEVLWGQELRKELAQHGRQRLITVDPSHRRATRRWPAAHFGELCRMLADRLDLLPVVLWGPDELPVAEAVVKASRGSAVVAPATDLRQSAALIKAADAHLGNCSAPRHIAVAVNTPSFTILGSTSRGWAYPSDRHLSVRKGIECQPCNQNYCDIGIICLTTYDPRAALAAFRRWAMAELGW
ncbi:MAG: glycosyltransferase family 9 protein [Desulfosarcinaceae bacterium]|nr:glycosyltransferase family 9 protein [Desulfosarcinaceae bacterium]